MSVKRILYVVDPGSAPRNEAQWQLLADKRLLTSLKIISDEWLQCAPQRNLVTSTPVWQQTAEITANSGPSVVKCISPFVSQVETALSVRGLVPYNRPHGPRTQ